MDVHGARLAGVVVAPDLLQQLVAGEDLARVAHEEREQLERLGLDRDSLPVAQDAVSGEVDRDAAQVDERRRACRRGGCSARREERADPGASSSRRLKGLVT